MLDKLIKGRAKTGKTSKFYGVCFRKDNGNWRAYLKINGIHLSLGSFKSEIDAAKSYDKKCVELKLPYPLNFNHE